MGTAAVIPMGSAYHSDKPVPKRPPLLGVTGTVALTSSSRGAELWKVKQLGRELLLGSLRVLKGNEKMDFFSVRLCVCGP